MTSLLAALCLFAEEPVRLGPDVKPPQVTLNREPNYTDVARDAKIQGSVVLSIVVAATGEPTDITILSPLGFGLDEEAVRAVREWRFVPGKLNGRPVPVYATVEMTFRLPAFRYDPVTEKRRGVYNTAAHALSKSDPLLRSRAAETIVELAKEKYPPAMYLYGRWLVSGEEGQAPDPAAGEALIDAAASKKNGPALYHQAGRLLSGPAKDPERARKLISEAALRGSTAAQFHLARMYEDGRDVPRDLDRAKEQYRQCAGGGVVECQWRLARLLMDGAARGSFPWLHGLAWAKAASAAHEDARGFVEREWPSLRAADRTWIDDIAPKLVRTPGPR